MARPLRIEYPGAFYHVMNRGLERREIFRSSQDYEKFLTLFDPLFDRYQIRIHSYCLMPNHYHLYIETPQGHLSKIMRQLDGVYTQNYNRRYKRVGPLMQGRYKAILIEKESYSLELSRYIHLNPVKAGLVKDPQDWAWSSYRIFLGKENKKKWMERDWLLSQFSESERQARKLFERFTLQGVDKEWNPQQEAKGFVLGGEEFSRWVREEWVRGKNKSDVTGIKELEKKIISVQERIERVNSLTNDRKLKRKLQIYVARKYSPVSLREIGEQMGGMRYQAVHLVIKRLEESAKRDRRIREFLERCQ